MAAELVLYCDESDSSGKHYGNFYGGALVCSIHLQEVIQRLEDKKIALNLLGEVKWQKITDQYLQKYLDFVEEIFALVCEDKIKFRVMFTHNAMSLPRLTPDQREQGFFLLYYQFIKHAFGLRFANDGKQPMGVRIYFDMLPDTAEKAASFKGYVLGLNRSKDFQRAKVFIRNDQLAEIDSKEHVVLQALDVVLGAMQFRLNDKHLENPEGARVRGKRTIAKEKVYKFVLAKIREAYGGRAFNIGISTGKAQGLNSLWVDPYRHWRFVAKHAMPKPEFKKHK